MVKIELLAKDIQYKLEDISYELYGEDYPQFNITDDMQIYQNRAVKKGGRRYTPGIIRLVPGMAVPTAEWGVRSSYFELELLGYRDEKRKVQEIFRVFAERYNSQLYQPEVGNNAFGSDVIIPLINELAVSDLADSADGNNLGGFVANVGIIFSVFIGGLTAKETSLYIEQVRVPFEEISYSQGKALVANIPYTNSSSPQYNVDQRLAAESLIFTVPFNVSQEFDDVIIPRIIDPTYNDVFTIELHIGDDTIERKFHLKSANIEYNQHSEIIGVALAFEAVPKAITVKIDGEDLPIMNFSLSSKRETESFNFKEASELEIQHIHTSYTYAIGMTALIIDNEVSDRLLEEITNNSSDVSHELIITLPNGVEQTYEVILVEGTLGFEDRETATMGLTFIGEFKY